MGSKRKPKIYVAGDDVSTSIMEKRALDDEYIRTSTRTFLQKLKNEKTKKILCSKALATYFGTTYSAVLNTVPVTVKFDGREHEYPESVANWLLDKFLKVTDSNTPRVENETLQ